MQQMGHGTMLDADGRPDETPPVAGGDAMGARLAYDWCATRGQAPHAGRRPGGQAGDRAHDMPNISGNLRGGLGHDPRWPCAVGPVT
jgi:hypothetical protein